MNSENLPNNPNDQYDPNLEAQDEEVTSGGNNKLLYILVGVLLALVVGYIALPKGDGSSGGLSSVTPSFMLDDAAVTGTSPTAADSIAAGLKAAPVAAAVADATSEKVEKSTTRTTSSVATSTSTAGQPVEAAPEAAPIAVAAPEPAAPEPVAAPAAPSNVSMSGRIEDENGRPLVGATVMLKGSSKATSTDANGNYTIEVPVGTENTLMYGYGGYDDQMMRTRGSQPMNVTLTPHAKAGRKRR